MGYPENLKGTAGSMEQRVVGLMNTVLNQGYFGMMFLTNPLVTIVCPTLAKKYGDEYNILANDIPAVVKTMDGCRNPKKKATDKEKADYFYKNTKSFIDGRIRYLKDVVKAQHDLAGKTRNEQRRQEHQTKEFFYKLIQNIYEDTIIPEMRDIHHKIRFPGTPDAEGDDDPGESDPKDGDQTNAGEGQSGSHLCQAPCKTDGHPCRNPVLHPESPCWRHC